MLPGPLLQGYKAGPGYALAPFSVLVFGLASIYLT